MKQIILILISVLLVSCKQDNNSSVTKNIEKDSISKTNLKNKQESKLEVNLNEYATPIDIALTFINSYIIDSNKMKESVGYLKFVNSSNLTTNNFKSELKKIVDKANKEDPEMGLDVDPIVPGNDYPEEGFEFETFDKKTNLIVVKGKNWADFKVTIKMVLEDNKWLVDGCGMVNIPEDKQ